MLSAGKVVDANAISESIFAYYDLGDIGAEQQTLFGGTARTIGYGQDQFGYRTSTTYPDNTSITRTNTWDGRIDGLSRGGVALAGYDYLGQRVAWRAYNTTTPVVAAYSYDMLGRVTDIDADSSRVDLHYSYVPQEHNIAGIRFDHRPGTPYNSYGYDDLDRVT